jgi:protocatechuate 3,4-dioxygenase, alpha subunit
VAASASPSQTSGPLFGFSLLYAGSDHAVDPAGPGAVRVAGTVLDGDGAPLERDALVELWHGELFARARTDAAGRFVAYVAKPDRAPLPDGRAQAPYLNVTVFARGLLKQVQTRMYFPDEADANARDPVLELVEHDRRGTLIARQEAGGLRFDVHLQGPEETVFFDF